jgi:hypothetical protein
VRVELEGYQFHVIQGQTPVSAGFVRRGAEVEVVSRQSEFLAVRARGSAFFALTLDGPGRARRRLDRGGVVELSSASGQCWMHAVLFASDHPYLTRTAADGSFALSQVPPGTYDLVCWLPDWHPASQERNADTWQIERIHFRPPLEKVQKVRIAPRTTAQARFVVTPSEFER